MSKRFVLVAYVASALTGCGKAIPSETYQDCYLNKVNSAANASIAELVRVACAKKFQQSLPADALEKLEGRAGFDMAGFVVNIDNRNESWMLTQIEFFVSTDTSLAPRPYRQDVAIDPLSEGYFYPHTENPPKEGAAFSWGIVRAWGIRESSERQASSVNLLPKELGRVDALPATKSILNTSSRDSLLKSLKDATDAPNAAPTQSVFSSIDPSQLNDGIGDDQIHKMGGMTDDDVKNAFGQMQRQRDAKTKHEKSDGPSK